MDRKDVCDSAVYSTSGMFGGCNFSFGDAVYNGVHREEALAASGSKLPVCDGSLQSRENEQAYFLVCDHACPSSRRRWPYSSVVTWRLYT